MKIFPKIKEDKLKKIAASLVSRRKSLRKPISLVALSLCWCAGPTVRWSTNWAAMVGGAHRPPPGHYQLVEPVATLLLSPPTIPINHFSMGKCQQINWST